MLVETQNRFFCCLGGGGGGGSVYACQISNCPLGGVLTYKSLIYVLNLQIYVIGETCLRYISRKHLGRAKVKD